MRLHRSVHRSVTAVAALAVLILAGCADPAVTPAGESGPGQVRLYGTDGTMQTSFGAGFTDPAILHGMKGTAPLHQLPSEFVRRLRGVDPSLADFLFAGETYDAIVISALAAELAGTPEPATVRTYINGVTTGGQECREVAECLALARAGEDLAYRGMSIPRTGFTPAREPAVASYATLHFGPDGVIDGDKTEFVGVGDPAKAETRVAPDPHPRPPELFWSAEPLKFGGLLPESGDLSFVYPTLIAAVQLAIQDINEAGGVFGVDVVWVDGDDGTDPAVARQTLQSHIDQGVHVVIGAASSEVTEAVLPEAVDAERILFSPASTAAHLISLDEAGFLFRTAPSDRLQGSALADILLRDGIRRVAIVARDDSYGNGLQTHTQEALLEFGLADSDVRLFSYGPPQREGGLVPELAELTEQIVAAAPEGVVVIGYREAAQVIQRLADQGLVS